jgi:hypothetical protein
LECIAAMKSDMRYTVVLSDGKLMVRSLRSNDVPLLPVSTDLFYGGNLNGSGTRIRFVRDTQGHITGALLNTPRVYNFRLVRSQSKLWFLMVITAVRGF